jgi:hypothetical protein
MSVTFLDEDGVARLVGTILGITSGGNLASTLAIGNDAAAQQIAGLGNPTNPQDADTLFSRDAAIAVVLLDPRFPTADQKAALAGSSGAPAVGNPYVTDADARNANARTPTAHVHAEADVTNLGSDLAGKAASVHTHAEADVTNLASDLAGKAAASHTHTEADVTSLVADLALKEPGSPVIWTTVTKGSDQSVASSTAVTNDSALFFATVNGAVYEIERHDAGYQVRSRRGQRSARCLRLARRRHERRDQRTERAYGSDDGGRVRHDDQQPRRPGQRDSHRERWHLPAPVGAEREQRGRHDRAGRVADPVPADHLGHMVMVS